MQCNFYYMDNNQLLLLSVTCCTTLEVMLVLLPHVKRSDLTSHWLGLLGLENQQNRLSLFALWTQSYQTTTDIL